MTSPPAKIAFAGFLIALLGAGLIALIKTGAVAARGDLRVVRLGVLLLISGKALFWIGLVSLFVRMLLKVGTCKNRGAR